jgi:hypothetical protein
MNERTKFYIVLGIILVIGAIFWFSHEEADSGTVTAKWVETSTSCDDDGCSTTYTYLVQLDKGTVYQLFWGTRDFDRMQPGMKVQFTARGYHVRLWGWRIATPTIFSWNQTQ